LERYWQNENAGTGQQKKGYWDRTARKRTARTGQQEKKTAGTGQQGKGLPGQDSKKKDCWDKQQEKGLLG
jgi:hypothetical protein